MQSIAAAPHPGRLPEGVGSGGEVGRAEGSESELLAGLRGQETRAQQGPARWRDDALLAWLTSRMMERGREDVETAACARDEFVDDAVEDSLAALDAVFDTAVGRSGVNGDWR